jgi:uncharacterized membrane protein
LLSGVGLGAGLMYAFDPRMGRRRRARIGDQAAHLVYRAAHAYDTARRDATNRTRGALCELADQIRDEYVPDNIVAARVRAELGLLVRHPHRIQVTVDNRCVTLGGTIEADELYRLLDGVATVPGVANVEDRLDVNLPDKDEIPREPLPRGHAPEIFQQRWSPTTRLLAGGFGAALVVGGARRHDAIGMLMGLGLIGRAATNLTLARLTGIGAGRRAVDIQKTINIVAPVDQVYGVWMRYASFPFYMDHVLDIQREGEERSHWTVAGPGGSTVCWGATVTEEIPNKRLTWETTPESAIQHAGSVAFERNGDGSTRVTIRMSYNPPGGALGHALAVLLGYDPRHLMDHDLVQLKSLIERGKTTAHHQEVTHEIPVAETEPLQVVIPEGADVAG